MMQDQSFQVRSNFLNKLIGHLQSRQLDPRYNMVLFMTALDPEDEIRSKVINLNHAFLNDEMS